MEKKVKLFFLACMMFSAVATAAKVDDRLYLVPAVGYVSADVNQVVENDILYAIGVGKPLDEDWNLELTLSRHVLDPENSTNDFKQTGLSIDALYFFSRNTTFATYGAFGYGRVQDKFGTVDKASYTIDFGLGGQSTFGKNNNAFRVDLRYRRDDNAGKIMGEPSFEDFILTMGLVIPLGANP